jgi:hypothetical protein
MDAARALPEAAEELTALDVVAEERALASMEKRVEAGVELDYEQALADAKVSLKPEIEARLDAYLGQVWEAVVASQSAEQRSFAGVSKAWRFAAPDDVDRSTLDWFLRTNTQIFNRGENGVTPVLRHRSSSTNLVVRVTAIGTPEKQAMFEDPEGMARARTSLSFQRLSEVFSELLDPEAIKADHLLKLPNREAPEEG